VSARTLPLTANIYSLYCASVTRNGRFAKSEADTAPRPRDTSKIGSAQQTSVVENANSTSHAHLHGVVVSCTETNRFQNGWGNFDLMIETLQSGLQDGPWLLGEQLTAADVLVGSSVVFMRQIAMLPDSKLIADYADRCLERPAYQRALAAEAD